MKRTFAQASKGTSSSSRDERTDAVDAAYSEKYGRRHPTIVPSIVTPEARAATLKLLPR